MRIPVRPHSTATLKRKLTRAKLRILEIAAWLAESAGLGALAAALRAVLLEELLTLSAEVRANLCLQALNLYRFGKQPTRRTIPRSFGPDVRFRRKRAGIFRRATHATFKRSGLAARDPEKLIAALQAAIAAAPRLIADLLARLNRGFKGQQPTLGRPIAVPLIARPAPSPAFAADTS